MISGTKIINFFFIVFFQTKMIKKRPGRFSVPDSVKKQKKDDVPLSGETILSHFCNSDGELTGPKLSLPKNISVSQLQLLLNKHILKNVIHLLL